MRRMLLLRCGCRKNERATDDCRAAMLPCMHG
jgi:hypothetical protein